MHWGSKLFLHNGQIRHNIAIPNNISPMQYLLDEMDRGQFSQYRPILLLTVHFTPFSRTYPIDIASSWLRFMVKNIPLDVNGTSSMVFICQKYPLWCGFRKHPIWCLFSYESQRYEYNYKVSVNWVFYTCTSSNNWT